MTSLSALYRLIQPALRPAGNAASFSNERWSVQREPGRLVATARVRITNEAGEREVMLHDVRLEASLLSDAALDGLTVRCTRRSLDVHYPPRADGYWTAYVIHPHEHTELDLAIEVSGDGTDGLYAVCALLHVDTYGAEGLRHRVHPVVLPLQRREPAERLTWRDAAEGLQVAPVRTHLLTPVDDPVEVVKHYVGPHLLPGDVLAIGESPLAVMQGRFRHPAEVRVSKLTGRLCYFLSGEGSVGTGPGLQTLVDQFGSTKVVWALLRGLGGKLAGRDGDFYRTLGEQSRLIDDVTGTLPPYDRFLVLGPADADRVARDIQAATGLEVAIVDANDLGGVDVVGATPGLDEATLKLALRRNPAGNGDESTPLVLIRRTAG